MRLRNVKNKEEILNASSFLVRNPKDYFGKWSSYFGNSNPIYIEIGMGKGKFIRENAKRYPNINFIGIEKYDSVVARCLPNIDPELKNLAIIRMDALEIDQVFSSEVSRVYLNFSDPWPKKRHHLRRLSSKVFLEKYATIFLDNTDVDICMRTDNLDLFCYSLMSFSEAGYVLRDLTFDLHKNLSDDLVTTEYEDRFSSKGMPIYAVRACRVSKTVNK